jgi:hypothetical protein
MIMPYKIRKVRNQDCWSVKNEKTGKVHAKCTSLTNAEKQVKILNAIEHNPKFRARKT